MKILAIETSTDYGTCALWRDGVTVERSCPAGRPHSDTLLPLISTLLADSGVKLGELDAIAFGAGPGAFTGLRIACGIAQGLAVGADLPLVPVGTLEAMAADCDGEQVIALLDARMNEVYAGRFRRHGDACELLGDIVVAAPETIALPDGGNWLAVGNAIAAYGSLAKRLEAAGIEQLPKVIPRAGRVAELAVSVAASGKSVDPALAAPIYVRNKVARTVAERLAVGGRA